MNLPAMTLCDFYKLSHREMYPEGTEFVYSTWTPRTSRLDNIDYAVVFGLQAFIQDYLCDFFTTHFFSRDIDEITSEYKRLVKYTLGIQDADVQHIVDLHALQYLPLCITALPEGTVVPLRTPTMAIWNTDKRFGWLTNYIETIASSELWQASTSATIAHSYRKILDFYAMKTVGNTDFVQFQGHDFSMRGMSTVRSAVMSGMGHLLSFVGTDTIPAIHGAEEFYDANIEFQLIGTSIPATEHSIQCAYGDDFEYIKTIITKIHPTGLVSIVSDGYDFWDVIGNVLPALKNEIMSRNGGPVGDKVVIRPDSGCPVKIICGDHHGKTELERKGAVEALWDIFGGTYTEEGYKLLDSHIGLIYGDAITRERADQICTALKWKGFASTNVVFGIGSFTYQYNTRDSLGYALKSTLCIINGEEKLIWKDPKTDNGIKKSQRGAVCVYKDDNGDIKFSDGHSLSAELDSMMRIVFKDGITYNRQSFSEIRSNLSSE